MRRRIGRILVTFILFSSLIVTMNTDGEQTKQTNPSIETPIPIAGITLELTKDIEDINKADIKDEIITTEIKEEPIVGTKKLIRYCNTAILNIREEPNTDSDIIGKISFGDKVVCYKYLIDKDWLVTHIDGEQYYINKRYLKKKLNSTYYDVTPMSKFKSYMGYHMITSTSSQQYKLQEDAYTGNYGVMMVDSRYCVAIGSRFDCNIGQYFDVILENGTVIPCIKADEKADVDTDDTNTYTVKSNYCCTEFVVDTSSLIQKAKRYGSLEVIDEWDSKVCGIRIYKQHH